MSILKKMFFFILTVMFFISAACEADVFSSQQTETLPKLMLGAWQVTSVLTDQGKKTQVQGLGDKYIIPKYLGRIVSLESDRLSINTPYDETCEMPEFFSHKSSAEKIIAKSISSRFPEPSHPTPQDMGLALKNNTLVNVLYLVCEKKLRAKDEGMSALADLTNVVWFIQLDKNKLAMSWHEETILILKRLSKNAKPEASFNCEKAGTLVEKTICGSVGVAAYDKSLSQSYKLVMAYYKSNPNTKSIISDLKKSQREWLKQRDACGADSTCLEKVMSIRIGDLNYDLGDYMYQNR